MREFKRLPRKTKKGLKKALNAISDNVWKTSEIRIDEVETYWKRKHRNRNVAVFNNKVVTACRVG